MVKFFSTVHFLGLEPVWGRLQYNTSFPDLCHQFCCHHPVIFVRPQSQGHRLYPYFLYSQLLTVKFSNHSFDCRKQTDQWFKASSEAEIIQRQKITNTAHRRRLATPESAEILFLYPEFLIRDIQLNNDPHIARGRSDPLVLPDPRATVLCCINSEFLGVI